MSKKNPEAIGYAERSLRTAINALYDAKAEMLEAGDKDLAERISKLGQEISLIGTEVTLKTSE